VRLPAGHQVHTTRKAGSGFKGSTAKKQPEGDLQLLLRNPLNRQIRECAIRRPDEAAEESPSRYFIVGFPGGTTKGSPEAV